jgi:hypothetical protein
MSINKFNIAWKFLIPLPLSLNRDTYFMIGNQRYVTKPIFSTLQRGFLLNHMMIFAMSFLDIDIINCVYFISRTIKTIIPLYYYFKVEHFKLDKTLVNDCDLLKLQLECFKAKRNALKSKLYYLQSN